MACALDENNTDSTLEPTGVILRGNTSGFKFSGNHFFSDGTQEDVIGDLLLGTDVYDLGEGMDNRIEKNIFTNLQISNRANGVNAEKQDGLVYLCNEQIDGVVTPVCFEIASGRIRENQGEDFGSFNNYRPSGNIFSDISTTIKNNGEAINYYSTAGVAEEQITYGFGFGFGFEGEVNPNDGTGMINCSEEEPCPPPCDIEFITIKKNNFNDHEDEYAEIIDVLTTLQSHTDVFSTTTRKATIIRQKMNNDLGYILRHYQHSEETDAPNNLIEWLNKANTYAADLRLWNYYFFNSQTSEIDQIVQKLRKAYTLSDYQSNELKRVEKLFEQLAPFLDGEGGLLRMDEDVLIKLKDFLSECDEAGYLSAMILEQHGQKARLDCNEVENRVENSIANLAPPKEEIKVYPNPSSQELTIDVGNQSITGIQVLDLRGQKVYESQVVSQSKTTIDLMNIIAGIYFLKIKTDKTEFTEKVIIQK